MASWTIKKIEYNGVHVHFFEKDKSIGELKVEYPGNDFWYDYYFPNQSLHVKWTWHFCVVRNDKELFHSEKNFNRDIFLQAQRVLKPQAQSHNYASIYSMFREVARGSLPQWLEFFTALENNPKQAGVKPPDQSKLTNS